MSIDCEHARRVARHRISVMPIGQAPEWTKLLLAACAEVERLRAGLQTIADMETPDSAARLTAEHALKEQDG